MGNRFVHGMEVHFLSDKFPLIFMACHDSICGNSHAVEKCHGGWICLREATDASEYNRFKSFAGKFFSFVSSCSSEDFTVVFFSVAFIGYGVVGYPRQPPVFMEGSSTRIIAFFCSSIV